MGSKWDGLGATRFRWRADVRRVVRAVEANFPTVRANTYVGHPWPGWGRVSVDFWGPGGRGDPIPLHTGHRVRAFIFHRPGLPMIRHTIYLHQLWTSFGGYSFWGADDHSDELRHVHVTYWK
jgi:hypothetical protein